MKHITMTLSLHRRFALLALCEAGILTLHIAWVVVEIECGGGRKMA